MNYAKFKKLIVLIKDLIINKFSGSLTILFHHGGVRDVKKEEHIKL